MKPVTVQKGSSPVVLAFPHSSTHFPDDTGAGLNANGTLLSDTDWHLPKLYAGLLPGATYVEAHFHRYAIDANRDPSGQSLYPGQSTTGLVPDSDFDGVPIRDTPLTPAHQMQRLTLYHDPYHAALKEQLRRVREKHGFAILYDCHSIRSQIPRLFDGILPDLNIGTFNGASCALSLAEGVIAICKGASDFSTVVNARFKGGWTTRHFGRPDKGVHAIQMEIAQSTYLKSECAPWTYDAERAKRLRDVLEHVLHHLNQWSPT